MKKLLILAAFLLLAVSVSVEAQVTARRDVAGVGVPTGSCLQSNTAIDKQVRIDVNPFVIYFCRAGVWEAFSAGGSGAGGSSGQVNYNQAGTLTGNAQFTFDFTTGTVSATAFSGNASASNLNTGTVPDARLSSDIMRLATAQAKTVAALSFGDGLLKFIGGAYGASDESLPAVTANSVLFNTDSGRFFIGNNGATQWQELYLSGVSAVNLASANVTGILPLANGGAGQQTVQLVVTDFTTDTATGDGQMYFVVPAKLNGMNLVGVTAQVVTAGTTGTTNVDLDRCAVVATGNMCSGTVSDMLSTNLTIDSGENKSSTAATPAVINTSNDDVVTDQVVRVNIDAMRDLRFG